VHKQGALPDHIRDVVVARNAILVERKDRVVVLDRAALLTELGLTSSKSEARRLFGQDGVRQDGKVVEDPEVHVGVPGRSEEQALRELEGTVWQVGRRRFARVAGIA
jgi:tyrosyl-tRNA synthetase